MKALYASIASVSGSKFEAPPLRGDDDDDWQVQCDVGATITFLAAIAHY